MATRSQTGILTGGLIFIGIGLLFLLRNLYGFSVWWIIARYWPILLIFIGIKKIYGYFTWQGNLPAADSPHKE